MKIKWIGDDRELPGIGFGTKGAELDGPDDVMASYVSQGLAKELKTKQEEDDGIRSES